ncbi:MAG: RNA polymerase sigma-54 factor [Rhodospirillales bacterium 70-18]|nr:RNA polymerase factor sigma-54 [Rhodospirillales bacterium]OJY78404.1 MAG: RNA polymerase sigma-54 factor [Rhodospirillales bacterium 70-18]
MAIGPRLDLRQSQSLVMTPQLRQAIKLLQFSNVEVGAFVEEELERNPLLERDESSDAPAAERAAPDQVVLAPAGPRDPDAAPMPGERDFSDPAVPDVGETLREESGLAASGAMDAEAAETYDPGGASDGGRGAGQGFEDDERGIDDFAEGAPTLREHLGEQLRLSFADPTDRLIGAYLIALLEPSGRLSAAPEALAQAMGAPVERVEAVRARMMRFDPTGMFARDLRECLAVQLAEKNRLDPAMAALLDNLELLARRDHKRLMQVCEVDGADLADMIVEIRRLDPKPGATWDATPPQPVVPDVLMRAAPDGVWILELNPETMPRVLVNHSFSARVLPRASKDDKAFLSEKLATATWLVKSLQQRAQTILKVASEIVRRQDGFFWHGVSHLRPLILRDIAEAVEMHESTVSRVTANKYMATPRGIYELKYFFTTAIQSSSGGETHSAEAIRHRIRALVDAETSDDILSDDAIVASLRKEGVDIARRTVAKYRDALHIPSSVQRKREKAVPG